jgi:hypothetical protein
MSNNVNVIRRCWNIKSRTHPDIQCPHRAIYGDFCSLHYKHPHYFSKKINLDDLSEFQKKSLARFFQTSVRKLRVKMFLLKGPCAYMISNAVNTSELASMESLDTILNVFRFSFKDNEQLWLFDIRSLILEKKRLEPNSLKNPYTGKELDQEIVFRLQKMITWLCNRKYNLEHLTFDDSEGMPTYRQKVLELCLWIDGHGYLTNTNWFEKLTPQTGQQFCHKLNSLWLSELNLTHNDRIKIFPTWHPANYSLFSFNRIHTRHIHHTIERIAICLLEFVKAANEKENRALACMYVLMALADVDNSCAETYSWLIQ